MNTLEKRCPSCQIVKSIEHDYYHNKSSKFVGVRALCKKCENEKCRQYKKQNREKVASYMKGWIGRNRDKKLKHMRAYNEKNPFRTNHVSVKVTRALYHAHPYCRYCGVGLSIHEASIDHKMPLFRGGTNALDNLAVSCQDCNYLKHTRTEAEFLLFLPVYTQRLHKKLQGNTEPSSSNREGVTVSGNNRENAPAP